MSELDKLIEAVEGGVDSPWRLTPFELRDYVEKIGFAFGGDLNAARALHDALLGKDCHFNLMEDEDAGGYRAEVYLSGWHYAGSSCPAHAWLIAILKAYRSQK